MRVKVHCKETSFKMIKWQNLNFFLVQKQTKQERKQFAIATDEFLIHRIKEKKI